MKRVGTTLTCSLLLSWVRMTPHPVCRVAYVMDMLMLLVDQGQPAAAVSYIHRTYHESAVLISVNGR